ncbi:MULTISPECIES: hypothetical protein [Legionella]|uniref:Uncharacterized protein n=1 Tax=Legionella drozanskii LLAP-1 TaxID=1212489 RepID=A0A0W0SVB9_9GAMM|nr:MULTISPECIES: hypothetical protein [Legionella]KTC87307.1 hypothetical protein Ldro_0926 [Legionella drozanskii LLAP-1]PJE17937.1 MAG: hypothetical protein CK430_01470 [Legionella sp.]
MHSKKEVKAENSVAKESSAHEKNSPHGFFNASPQRRLQRKLPSVSVTLDHISSPQTEEIILANQGKENLRALRKSLYTYSFNDHPLYDRIEVGINHIVIYPHPTQVGRKLLAFMVATMWDERNYPYFNVYKDLLISNSESGVEFVLDHSGAKYSNPVFNSPLNRADDHPHFHPKQSGTYHTHFHYGWQFSGLMAVHSVLSLGSMFLDKGDSKDTVNLETVRCLHDFSQYVTTLLLGSLPFHKLEQVEDLAKLKRLLNFIHQKGIFSLKDSEEMMDLAKNLTISPESISSIRKVDQVFNDDLPKVLRTFVYDLNNFAKNIEKMSYVLDESEAKLHQFGDEKSIEQLFQLACCLSHPETSIEFMDYEVLSKKAEALRDNWTSLSASEQMELDLFSNELKLRELRRMAHLDNQEQLQLLRKEFTENLKLSEGESALTQVKTDAEMVGFRSRVAERITAKGLTFKVNEVKEDLETVKVVSRPDTHAALGKLQVVAPDARQEIAADLFLQPTMHYKGEKAVSDKELSSESWESIYPAIRHEQSKGGEQLLTTKAIHGVLYPNSKVNFAAMLPTIKSVEKSEAEQRVDSEVPKVELRARWHKVCEKTASPGQGTLQVLDEIGEIDFPIVKATDVSKNLLESFGVSLHSLAEDLEHKDSVTFYALEYEVDENYRKDHLLQEKGGGLALQRCSTSSYLIPTSEENQGGIILGRQVGDANWEFISLKVPCGYLLKIKPGAVHSASLCVGQYAMVEAAVKEVNSVQLRKMDNGIQPVAQMEPYSPSITLAY